MSLRSFLHIGETDCVAGVVGLELRNPLGSKSARIAGEFQRIWPKWAQQRRFACEPRRYQWQKDLARNGKCRTREMVTRTYRQDHHNKMIQAAGALPWG